MPANVADLATILSQLESNIKAKQDSGLSREDAIKAYAQQIFTDQMTGTSASGAKGERLSGLFKLKREFISYSHSNDQLVSMHFPSPNPTHPSPCARVSDPSPQRGGE